MKTDRKKRVNQVNSLVRRNYVEDQRQLYLPSSKLQGQDIEVIVNARLAALQTLKISDNPIGLTGAEFLRRGQWSHLKRLELKSSKIGPKAILELAKADWKHIEHLRLGFNHLGNEGMRYLREGDWKQLSELWLQGNHIAEEGIKWLTKSNWSRLHFLSLWDNKFSLESAKQLTKLDSPLKTLDITLCEGSQKQITNMCQLLRKKFISLDVRT